MYILFSDPDSFRKIADEAVVEEIRNNKNSYPSPEHINRSPDTAPSKRLKTLIPGYAKVRNGITLAENMGIDIILENCQHFREWVEMLKQIK